MYRKRRIIRKRRAFRRRPVRRFRRRRPNTGATALRFFKLRRVINVTIPVNQPQWFELTDNPSLSQDWVQVSELFQMYRCNGLKIQYIPSHNANTLQTDVPRFVPVYIVHDTNNMITSIPSENQILQYEGLKIRQVSRMWSHYQKMARRINPTSNTTVSTDGFITVTNPQATQKVTILIPAMANTLALDLGRFVITSYVSAKIRR